MESDHLPDLGSCNCGAWVAAAADLETEYAAQAIFSDPVRRSYGDGCTALVVAEYENFGNISGKETVW